ncbi:MAG TPA: SprT family zinc-dependent metalloprotease [Azospirillaceae bacterium]|nr:SprT family zinc-dependent metalloprotease [Azospirillaceae bacterium]HRQ80628.1 SprT family zinc-dependent metalloprotease [Azospirillaceae bacterium]
MFGFLFPSAAKRGAKPVRGQRKSSPKPAPPRPLAVPGIDSALILRESARARRYTLKVDAARGVIEVVTPPAQPQGQVLDFVVRHIDWVKSRLAKTPAPVPFTDGAEIPIAGRACRIRHDPKHRGAPVLNDDVLTVGGGAEFLARRVRDWLIGRARAEIVPAAHAKAATLGRKVAGVTLRDTRSRWGSCTAAGRLSFSWRLVMAPPLVLDYVVAHEAAHLVEMNHSQRFWALCQSLTADAPAARTWLKAEGSRLFRYG